MPPKIQREPTPVRAAAPCARDFTNMPSERLGEYTVSRLPIRLCRTCGHRTDEHPDHPRVGVQAPAAALPAPQAAQAAPNLQLQPPQPQPGPLNVTRVVQFAPSGLTFLAHVALWKNSRVMVDDSDEVANAIEEIETAWFHGSNEIANACSSSSGASVTPVITTTFAWAPLPPIQPPPQGADNAAVEAHNNAYRTSCETIRRQRSRDLKAALPLARAVLRYCRAYARRRTVVDDAASHYAARTKRMSDEWTAIVRTEAKAGLPVQTAQDVELSAEHFRSCDKALWWFLAAAASPINDLSRILEGLVRAYGEHFRSLNRDMFVPVGVWEAKYSPEALAAKRGHVASVPQKRDRPPSLESADHGRQDPPTISGKARRRKRYRQMRAEKRAAADAEREKSDDRDKTAVSAGKGQDTTTSTAPQLNAATVAAGGRGGFRNGGRGNVRGARGNVWQRGRR